MRVNETNDHQREIALNFYQIHSTDSLRIQMYMNGNQSGDLYCV